MMVFIFMGIIVRLSWFFMWFLENNYINIFEIYKNIDNDVNTNTNRIYWIILNKYVIFSGDNILYHLKIIDKYIFYWLPISK